MAAHTRAAEEVALAALDAGRRALQRLVAGALKVHQSSEARTKQAGATARKNVASTMLALRVLAADI